MFRIDFHTFKNVKIIPFLFCIYRLEMEDFHYETKTHVRVGNFFTIAEFFDTKITIKKIKVELFKNFIQI